MTGSNERAPQTTKPQLPSPSDLHWAMAAAWETYQARLGNRTTREENAILNAFSAGWNARGNLS